MAPAELNGRPERNGLRPITKMIASGLIVLFLGGVSRYIWELQGELQELRREIGRDYVLMAVHRADLDRLNDFMTEGERFTLERGEGIEEDLKELMNKHEALKLEVSENKLVVARMPMTLRYPFTTQMQKRLVEAEKGIAINNQRINEVKRQLKVEN